MQVDEARRDHLAARIDLLLGRFGREIADGRDAITVDGDIGANASRSRSVDECAAANDQIVGHVSPLLPGEIVGAS